MSSLIRLSAWCHGRAAAVIVLIALALTLTLLTVERATGLPASLRGAPVYQPLPSSALKRAATRRSSVLARRLKRLRQRAVRPSPATDGNVRSR